MCGTEEEASSESELVSLLRGGLSAVLFLRSGDLSLRSGDLSLLVVFLLPAGNSGVIVSILLLVKRSDVGVKPSLDGNERSEDGNLSELFDRRFGLFPTRLGLDLRSDPCLLTEWPCTLFCCPVMLLTVTSLKPITSLDGSSSMSSPPGLLDVLSSVISFCCTIAAVSPMVNGGVPTVTLIAGT